LLRNLLAVRPVVNQVLNAAQLAFHALQSQYQSTFFVGVIEFAQGSVLVIVDNSSIYWWEYVISSTAI
jgi:hypothetical protein